MGKIGFSTYMFLSIVFLNVTVVKATRICSVERFLNGQRDNYYLADDCSECERKDSIFLEQDKQLEHIFTIKYEMTFCSEDLEFKEICEEIVSTCFRKKYDVTYTCLCLETNTFGLGISVQIKEM